MFSQNETQTVSYSTSLFYKNESIYLTVEIKLLKNTQQGQMLEGKIAKPLLNFIIARYFSKGRDAQQP